MISSFNVFAINTFTYNDDIGKKFYCWLLKSIFRIKRNLFLSKKKPYPFFFYCSTKISKLSRFVFILIKKIEL